MKSKCCNSDLVPVLVSIPIPVAENETALFNSNLTQRGITHIDQYCSKCGKINRLKSTPINADEYCMEAMRI